MGINWKKNEKKTEWAQKNMSVFFFFHKIELIAIMSNENEV